MSDITIRPVEGKADIDRFIAAQNRIMRDVPHWIPPLHFERKEHLSPKKNLFLGNMEHQFWIAEHNGVPVGRISAQINPRHLKQYDDKTGQFGSFDVIDDPAVAKLLVETASSWLHERGMARMTGPFSHSINEESGLLVDGFDTPPMVMMGHNPPYYGRLLDGLGLAKAQDLLCFHFPVETTLPPKLERIMRRFDSNPRFRVRNLDRKNFQAEIDIICDIFNDAWADNWGFVPFGPEEARYLAQSLKPILVPEFVKIAEVDGKPAAMMMAIPNLNEAARDLDGRIFPFGWAKLVWRLKVQKTKGWRIPLMGVRRSLHSSSMSGIVAMGMIDDIRQTCMTAGIEWTELSWILESNTNMKNIILALGGRVYKTYRIYEKPLP